MNALEEKLYEYLHCRLVVMSEGVWGWSYGTAGLHLLWGAEAVKPLGDDAAGLGSAEQEQVSTQIVRR